MRWLALVATCLLVMPALAMAKHDEQRVRALVTRRLAAESPGFSEAARDRESSVKRMAAPGVHADIWRFEKTLATRPLLFYVAVVGDRVLLLTGNADKFAQLKIDAPKTEAAALALVQLFDEATRDGDQRRLPIASVDAIPFRSGLEGDKAKLRDDAKAALASRVKPAKAQHDGDHWRVTDYVIDGDALVERTFVIAAGITVQSTPLRTDLPLIYAN